MRAGTRCTTRPLSSTSPVRARGARDRSAELATPSRARHPARHPSRARKKKQSSPHLPSSPHPAELATTPISTARHHPACVRACGSARGVVRARASAVSLPSHPPPLPFSLSFSLSNFSSCPAFLFLPRFLPLQSRCARSGLSSGTRASWATPPLACELRVIRYNSILHDTHTHIYIYTYTHTHTHTHIHTHTHTHTHTQWQNYADYEDYLN